MYHKLTVTYHRASCQNCDVDSLEFRSQTEVARWCHEHGWNWATRLDGTTVHLCADCCADQGAALELAAITEESRGVWTLASAE